MSTLSLTDKQLIHRLKKEYGYTQTDIAEIMGCSQQHVSKVLRQSIQDIEQQIAFVETYPMDDGCYRTAYHHSEEDGLTCYQQSISPYSDPTFASVADMEDEEE